MSETLIQKVSTGDICIFDKKNRELVIIAPEHADEWNQNPVKSFSAAEKFVAANKAKKFSRGDLQSIQSALAGIVLLE